MNTKIILFTIIVTLQVVCGDDTTSAPTPTPSTPAPAPTPAPASPNGQLSIQNLIDLFTKYGQQIGQRITNPSAMFQRTRRSLRLDLSPKLAFYEDKPEEELERKLNFHARY